MENFNCKNKIWMKDKSREHMETLIEVLLNQKRINVCKDTVKMALHVSSKSNQEKERKKAGVKEDRGKISGNYLRLG